MQSQFWINTDGDIKGPAAAVAAAAASSSSSSSSSPSSSRQPKRRRTSHIAVACNECRTRKQKCNGDRPICTACQDRSTECVYDAGPDGSRTTALKNETATLEKEAALMRELVEVMRHYPRDSVEGVVNGLRDGEEVGVVLARAREGLVMRWGLARGDSGTVTVTGTGTGKGKGREGKGGEIRDGVDGWLVDGEGTVGDGGRGGRGGGDGYDEEAREDEDEEEDEENKDDKDDEQHDEEEEEDSSPSRKAMTVFLR
ncbi:hypothetical protein CAC42_4565 [Sphaceloma murrayae]|uniref:Zn(2)-C6 fungal-type domain-containing protein n=1 Tax=Sphaceloma murrayae TaxID=2082308 RepID=A0A2K1QNL7_9PEZI|nr:hypothetical protein CAC42_4565 [Sphaceloma murrayae]